MLETKLLKSSSMTVLSANVKSKNNKNVKHNASRKKPKLLSTDNNLNKILLTKPMAKDPKLQTRMPKIKLRHKMMTSMILTCKIPLMFHCGYETFQIYCHHYCR